jgi:cytochrome P450
MAVLLLYRIYRRISERAPGGNRIQPAKKTMTSERISEVLGNEYDHYNPDFSLDPHATYAELRKRCPVGRSESYGGFYVVSTYDDIDYVIHNPDTFSSYPADTPPPPTHQRPLPPFEVDPPDHRNYRRIVDPLFGPKRMNALEPALREAAGQLVQGLVDQGECDFIASFAQPFPSSAFLSLIGLQADGALRGQLCAWVEEILHATSAGAGATEDHTAVRVKAARALRSFLSEVLEAGRSEPGTIFNELFNSSFAGERTLTRDEVLDFSYLLVLAGVDTVTTALGFSFMHLGRRPAIQDELVADQSKIPAAIEELLRFESAVHPSRTVTSPCTLSGVELKPGDRIVIPYASADRDEDVFEQADQIVLERSPNRHFAFGGGSHRCLGSHLARLEMRVAFEEILGRIPRFSIPEDVPIKAFGGQTRSLVSLPFRTWRP